MQVEISDWAWIPYAEYPARLLSRLKDRLTVTPRRTSQYQQEIVPIELFRERTDSIGVPRAFFIKHRKLHHQIVNKMSDGFPRELEFDGELIRDQPDAFQAVMDNYAMGSPGSIVQAVPGWGKTVWALYTWTRFKRTALVIVQKDFLLQQWKKRIEDFVPGARVGIIRQKKCEFGDDYDISIAMIQSLVNRKNEYPKELWSWPGISFTDEVHRIGSNQWSAVAPLFHSSYRIGLSATPKRKDGTDNVFFFHIGDVIYKSKVKKVVPRLRRIFTNFEFRRTPRFNPEDVSKEIQLRFLCANPKRNKKIVKELVAASQKDRKIIVLSERRKHLERLDELFSKVKTEDCVVDYYVGGRTQAELDKAEKADVIFATYQMAKEALDIPSLDTLFLVTPVSDVEQSVGRIMRDDKNKKRPIVVDFVDKNVGRFNKLYKTRLKFYRNEGMIKKEV